MKKVEGTCESKSQKVFKNGFAFSFGLCHVFLLFPLLFPSFFLSVSVLPSCHPLLSPRDILSKCVSAVYVLA